MYLLRWLAALVAAFFIGAGVGYIKRKPETRTETQTVEKVVTRTVKEKVKAPDGTVTEKVTKETTENTTTEAARPPQPVAARQSDYSLGVTWTPRLDADFYQPSGAEAGYRLLGDLWATGSYNWLRHEFAVGVRVEF